MSRSPTRRRRPLGSLLGWALAVPPAVLAVARLTRRDERPAIIAAQSIAPLGLALASLALAVAGVGRRRGLAALSGALVAAHVRWALPELAPGRAPPAEAAGAPRLRILTANLFTLNGDMAGLGAEILTADADVVLLQEVSFGNLPGLRQHGVVDAYPFQLLATRADAFGSGILSRLPLVDAEMWNAAHIPMSRGTVLVGDRQVRIYNVHPRSPFGPRGMTRWRSQLESLRDAVRAEPRPLVVAGDFNAAWGHRRFRDLLDEGLRDASVERGRGWVTTWPNDLALLPPLSRIDHVLVSPELAVLDVREGEGQGSDHRPVVVDLALLPGAAPAPASA